MTSVQTAVALPTGTRRSVMVAVDDAGSPAALREAASVAVARGVPLHVLHVVSWVDPVGLRSVNLEVLSTAVAESVALVAGAVHVTSELAYGGAVGRIVASGSTCGLTVVQRGSAPGGGADPDLRVSVDVAGAAEGPVLSVPWSWAHRTRPGTVVVALPDTGVFGMRLLRMAARVAVERRAALHVVHAAHPMSTEVELQALRRRVGAMLIRLPGGRPVPSRIDVVPGRAVEVILDVAAVSDLVVVGRHVPASEAGTRLGRVATSLAAGAPCPVLLAPVPVPVSR